MYNLKKHEKDFLNIWKFDGQDILEAIQLMTWAPGDLPGGQMISG